MYLVGAILPQGWCWDVRLEGVSVKAAEVYILREEDGKCSMRYNGIVSEVKSMVRSSLYKSFHVTDETTKTRMGPALRSLLSQGVCSIQLAPAKAEFADRQRFH